MYVFSAKQRGLGVVLLGVAVMLAGVYLETRNPRTNFQDDISWGVWSIGMLLIGAGVGIACKRSRSDIAILGIAFPSAGFLFLVVLFWTYIIVQSFF